MRSPTRYPDIALFCLAGALFLSLSGPAFSAGREQPGKVNGAKGREKVDQRIEQGRVLEGKVTAAELAKSLRLAPKELAAFLKELKSNSETDREAWTSLLNSAKSDAQAADLVSSLIRLKNGKAADNLSTVNEREMVSIQKNWSAEQKANFGRVLRRAADLAASGKALRTEDAFQQALKDLGFAKKLNSCKI